MNHSRSDAPGAATPGAAYRAHLRALLADELQRAIARALPWLVRRSLRRGLRGVWARGDFAALPPGGVLLAANHHSWWDPYLGWLLGRRLQRPLSGLMAAATLERFPFFRSHGALATHEVREALRRLQRGELLLVFPEGGLRAPGPPAALRPGAAFLAARAGVPVYPLALRVLLRGAQRPEAFLTLGAPLTPAPAGAAGRAAFTRQLARALEAQLRALDAELAAADPEAPPAGFRRWLGGRASTHERTGWAARLWRGGD